MDNQTTPRRTFLANTLFFAGLVAGYGMGVVHFFRYLVPIGRKNKPVEMFVGTLRDLPVGSSRTVKSPGGEDIAIARVSESKDQPAEGFKALSSICPHLGCRVHWQSGDGIFYCPCHNGKFDKDGTALSGPPAVEGKNLPQFPVKVDNKSGSVFVLVQPKDRHGA